MIEIISKQYNYLLLKSSSFRLLKTKQNVIAVIEFVLLFHIENIFSKFIFKTIWKFKARIENWIRKKKRNIMICDSVNDANKNNEKKKEKKN